MKHLIVTVLALLVAATTLTQADATSAQAAPAPAVVAQADAAARMTTTKAAATTFASRWHRYANARNWTWLRRHSTRAALQGFKAQLKFAREYYDWNIRFGTRTSCSNIGRGVWGCSTPRSAPCELDVKRRNGRWVAVGFYLYD